MTGTLVIGGGPAGAAAAAWLARDGLRPLLLERTDGPRHKICGEFLSTEAQRYLDLLGLDLGRLGGAPIDRVRLVGPGEGRPAEAKLPFRALGLTRRRLDEALLAHAAACGAAVDRGVTVRAIGAEGSSLSVEARGVLKPRTLLLATGKHDVRGASRDPAGTIDDLIGFKAYFRLSPGQRAALAGHIEVLLFDGGYAGLQLVEGEIANLCLLSRRDRWDAAGGRWEAFLADLARDHPHLDRRLADAVPLLDKPLAIAAVPYGYLHRGAKGEPPMLYRLGDQAAVIPSFSGDGMSIALHSARLAASAAAGGVTARAYHDRLARDLRHQLGLAVRLQRLGERPAGQRWLPRLAALMPWSLRLAAAATRVPKGAMMRAGVA